MTVQNSLHMFFCMSQIVQYFALLSPTAGDIYATMLSAMAASNLSCCQPILLYSPFDTGRLFVQIKQLPIPIKFLTFNDRQLNCEFYLHIGNKCNAASERYNHYVVPQKAVFIPYFTSMSKQQKKLVLRLSEYPSYPFFISSDSRHEDTLRLFSAARLCQVVSISSGDINAPADRFHRCGSREIVPAFRLFDRSSEYNTTFSKGKSYRASVFPEPLHRYIEARRRNNSEALPLNDSYETLNNTIEFVQGGSIWIAFLKNIDFVLMPVDSLLLRYGFLFEYAYYSPSRLCFFTSRRIAVQVTFIDSWRSVVGLLLSVVASGSFVAFFMRIRRELLLKENAQVRRSRIFLFLVNTFLGRSHPISPSTSSAYRSIAIAFWALGMMYLGSHVQTSITAIRAVPALSRHIKSFPDLRPYLYKCAMAPCMIHDSSLELLVAESGSMLKKYIESVADGSSRCPEPPALAIHMSECYEKARRGTHVAFSVTCTVDEVSAASERGLIASENLCDVPQVAPIHISHPQRYQHRRLLLAIAEHGLASPFQEPVAKQNVEADEGREQFGFYFAVYLIGCALSCAALAGEHLIRTFCDSQWRLFFG